MARTFGASPVDDAVERLQAFLSTVEALLQGVVDAPDGLFPIELHEGMASAWRTVQPRFGVAREHLPDVAEELERVGLTGAELTFKLDVANWAVLHFERAWAAMASGGKKGIAKAAGLFSSVLGIIDVPLDSLPSSLGIDAIKEFKGILEYGTAIVSQVQDDEPNPPNEEASPRPAPKKKYNF